MLRKCQIIPHKKQFSGNNIFDGYFSPVLRHDTYARGNDQSTMIARIRVVYTAKKNPSREDVHRVGKIPIRARYYNIRFSTCTINVMI